MNVPSSRSCAVSLFSRARPTMSPRARADLGQRQALDRADHRHDQPLRRGDGDADVRRRELQQRVLGVLHVHVAVAHQRLRAHLREQVGDRDAHVRVQLARCARRARSRASCRRSPSAGRRAPATRPSAGARSSCGCSSAGPTRSRRSERRPERPASRPRRARRPRRRSGPSGPVPRSDDSSMPRSRGDAARERRRLDAAAVALLRAAARSAGIGSRIWFRLRRIRFGCSGLRRGAASATLFALLADVGDRLADRRLARTPA